MAKVLFCLGSAFGAFFMRRIIWGDSMIVYAPLFGWALSEQETMILYHLLFFGNLLIFFLSKGREWDLCDFLLLSAFPFQIFALLLYSNYLIKPFWIALFAFGLCVLMEFVRFYKKVDYAKRHDRRLNIGKALRRTLGKLHYRSAMILLVLFCYIAWGPVKETPPWTLKESVGIKGESHMELILDVEGALWDSNQEGLKMLRQEVFSSLPLEEKVMALQFILDLEMVYWGCDAVQLIAQDFEDQALRGYYNNEKRIVALNDDLLNQSVRECIRVCLHEAYHAYQYACIENIDWKHADTELRMYKEIANWKYEFEHYSGASGWSTWEEYEKYEDQEVERTAREYADEWYLHYCYYIENLT